ncbi:MAG: aspartyl protease family protein [Candidatus Eremiobacteraeota bacterium]|nr:aspartyl protease family protein [Candidatus Eremiobacteraeota bacterium]
MPALILCLACSLLSLRPLAILHFESNGLLVSLKTRVLNSRPLPFTLDSGASASVVDETVSHELGLRAAGSITGRGAGAGGVRFAIYRDLDLTVGPVHWTARRALGVSLANVGTSQREAGLIGADFFFAFVVRIDYKRNEICVYKPRTYRYAGRGSGLPIYFAHHRPFVNVQVKIVGRAPIWRLLLVDSGSEDMLDDPVIAESPGAKTTRAGTGLGRALTAYYGPVQWARIGPYTLRGLQGTSGGVPLIGQGVLRRFIVTFDYARRRIYLEQRTATPRGP